MAIISTAVIEDAPQADGTRWLRFEYTWNDGHKRNFGPFLAPGATDANAVMAARQAQVAATQALEEKLQGWSIFVAGGDIDLMARHELTLNAVRVYCLKRLLNFMRSDSAGDENKALVASNVLPYINRFTDVQIANLIGSPNWPAAKVSLARARLVDISVAYAALDHGEAEFEDL